MNNYLCLCDLPVNSRAVISEVDKDIKISGRLADMGIIEGAQISAQYKSPFGDPVAYRVNNSVIAIRKSDSAFIVVEEIPYAKD